MEKEESNLVKRAILVFVAFLSVGSAFCRGAGEPLLEILTDTKQERDGLPVLSPHHETARISRELSRGFLATMLRLYRSVQVYLDPETVQKPAYLLFSSNQGGFPRFGSYLNGERNPNTAYVDLYGRKRLQLAGHFGAGTTPVRAYVIYPS